MPNRNGVVCVDRPTLKHQKPSKRSGFTSECNICGEMDDVLEMRSTMAGCMMTVMICRRCLAHLAFLAITLEPRPGLREDVST